MKTKITEKWEWLKENGFDASMIAVVSSNLFLFILMALRGVVTVWEPTRGILITEIVICVVFITWGIERLIRDLKE